MKSGENKRLHIQMIENTINRMSSNSFLIKGWSLTIIGGLLTIYFSQFKKPMSYLILILCFVMCLIFWISDAFYLWQERKFRKLYENIISKDENNIDFSMNLVDIKENFFKCMIRPIFLVSYLPLLLIIICMMNKKLVEFACAFLK